MASIALLDIRVRLTGHLLRDHLEVHHVMAGRRLMALRAIERAGGRVAEFRNRPHRRRVTRGAVVTEQPKVAVVIPMACGAVEHAL